METPPKRLLIEITGGPDREGRHTFFSTPEYYDAQERGEKPFELRYDDRGFELGDVLHLREWDVTREPSYTGRERKVRVTYLLRDFPGLLPRWVVMGTEPIEPGELWSKLRAQRFYFDLEAASEDGAYLPNYDAMRALARGYGLEAQKSDRSRDVMKLDVEKVLFLAKQSTERGQLNEIFFKKELDRIGQWWPDVVVDMKTGEATKRGYKLLSNEPGSLTPNLDASLRDIYGPDGNFKKPYRQKEHDGDGGLPM